MADETQTATEVESIPDRREQLANALDAIETTQEAPVETSEPEGAARGPDGKFVAADPAPAAAEPVEEPVWKRPPASWKKEYHDVWATAASNPDMARLVQYAAQREEEMRTGIEPLIPKAKFADQMQQAIEPYRANMQAAGVEPVAAMSALMQADHILRTAPAEQKKIYALNLMAQYGIKFEPEDAYQQPAPPDPNLIAIQNQLRTVNGELQSMRQQEVSREDAILQEQIAEFKKDKPDFDDLRPLMQQLLNKEMAKDIPDAYEKARRLDDTAFQKLQDGLQARALQEERDAADKAAKAAKAAAVSVRSSTPGARTPAKAQDRRSLLAEQFDSLTERF